MIGAQPYADLPVGRSRYKAAAEAQIEVGGDNLAQAALRHRLKKDCSIRKYFELAAVFGIFIL